MDTNKTTASSGMLEGAEYEKKLKQYYGDMLVYKSSASVICWKNTAKSRDGRLWQSIRTMASQVLTWSVLIYRGC